MIINNQHLLENRKRGLRDPRLPLTPAVLLAAATAGLSQWPVLIYQETQTPE